MSNESLIDTGHVDLSCFLKLPLWTAESLLRPDFSLEAKQV